MRLSSSIVQVTYYRGPSISTHWLISFSTSTPIVIVRRSAFSDMSLTCGRWPGKFSISTTRYDGLVPPGRWNRSLMLMVVGMALLSLFMDSSIPRLASTDAEFEAQRHQRKAIAHRSVPNQKVAIKTDTKRIAPNIQPTKPTDLFRDASLYRRLRRSSRASIFGWSILFLGRRLAIEPLVEVDGSLIYLHRSAVGGNSGV